MNYQPGEAVAMWVLVMCLIIALGCGLEKLRDWWVKRRNARVSPYVGMTMVVGQERRTIVAASDNTFTVDAPLGEPDPSIPWDQCDEAELARRRAVQDAVIRNVFDGMEIVVPIEQAEINPAEVLRRLASRPEVQERFGAKGVDHASFDRLRDQLNERVERK